MTPSDMPARASSTTTRMTPMIAVGDRVQLIGLNKRAELNGAWATVVKGPENETDRYTLNLNESGGCIRVRAANFIKESATSSSSRPSVVDSTLYVTRDGHFIQPACRMPTSDTVDAKLTKTK